MGRRLFLVRARWSGSLLLLSIAAVGLRPDLASAQPGRLPEPARLSATARAALHSQMQAHAREMQGITQATTLLDYAAVHGATQRLLAEPRIARPIGNDASELNTQLPPRFFTLQDRLRDEMQRLDRAAVARDPEGLADAFGAVTKSCVQCHDAYMTGR